MTLGAIDLVIGSSLLLLASCPPFSLKETDTCGPACRLSARLMEPSPSTRRGQGEGRTEGQTLHSVFQLCADAGEGGGIRERREEEREGERKDGLVPVGRAHGLRR